MEDGAMGTSDFARDETEGCRDSPTLGSDNPAVECDVADMYDKRMSHLARIKQRLRERESRLLSSQIDSSSARMQKEEARPYRSRSPSPSDGGDEDKETAMKALSTAAAQLRQQLDKKNKELAKLRGSLQELEENLKTKEEEKEKVQHDLDVFRKSVGANADHIERLGQDLEEKKSIISTLQKEKEVEKEIARDLRGQLAAAHEDFEWIRAESLSKSEQLEYFEYELLSKNDEIDKMRRELDQKVRRIVELEVDLERAEPSYSTPSRGVIIEEHDCEENSIVDASLASPPRKKHSGIGVVLDLVRMCQKVEDAEWQRSLEGPKHGKALAESYPIQRTITSSTSMTDTSQMDMSSVDTPDTGCSPSRDLFMCAGRNQNDGGFPTEANSQGSPRSTITPPNSAVTERLRSRLAAMDARYKRDKYNNMKVIEDLRQQNNEHLIRIACMEKKLHGMDDLDLEYTRSFDQDLEEHDNLSCFEASVVSTDSPPQQEINLPTRESRSTNPASTMLPNKVQFLEKKVVEMENERKLHRKIIEEVKVKVAEINKQARRQAQEDKLAIDELIFDNEAKAARIAELERDLPSCEPSDEYAEFVSTMELRTRKQYAEITHLHQEIHTKDETIEALRAELVELRMANQQQQRLHCDATTSSVTTCSC